MVDPPFYECGNHIIEGFSFVYDCTWMVQRKKAEYADVYCIFCTSNKFDE